MRTTSFYQMVLSQAVLSTDEATYDAENLVLEITFAYFDGSDPDVVTYCVAEARSSATPLCSTGGYNGIVRRSEVDTISGSVVRAGKKGGVPTPSHEFLVGLIHAHGRPPEGLICPLVLQSRTSQGLF